MVNFFNNFRQKVVSAASPPDQENSESLSKPKKSVDNLISLGVLLWVVAQADEKFLPEEKTKIGEVLNTYGHVSEDDLPIVLRAIEEANSARAARNASHAIVRSFRDPHFYTNDLRSSRLKKLTSDVSSS